jgi:hypothetical protein
MLQQHIAGRQGDGQQHRPQPVTHPMPPSAPRPEALVVEVEAARASARSVQTPTPRGHL